VSAKPLFLNVDLILQIHLDQIDKYGGSPGLRDITLVDSAANAPSASFGGQFLHADLFEMAAALLFALVMNHAFVDGNKRVGTAAALTFLFINGVDIENQEPQFSELVLRVASGKGTRKEVADFLRARARAKP
jgi:death on curing protein